jgi:hypothetical protein
MPTVVAAVVRYGRTFSGGATTHVVGDMGAGHDGPLRSFGCRAVMIACTCTLPSRCSGAHSSVADAAACS